MLDDKDNFRDSVVERRMICRGELIASLLTEGEFTGVSRYLINTAWKIDRDLVVLGLLPEENS